MRLLFLYFVKKYKNLTKCKKLFIYLINNPIITTRQVIIMGKILKKLKISKHIYAAKDIDFTISFCGNFVDYKKDENAVKKSQPPV